MNRNLGRNQPEINLVTNTTPVLAQRFITADTLSEEPTLYEAEIVAASLDLTDDVIGGAAFDMQADPMTATRSA